MRIEPEISGVSIVMLGSFNPAIFTPAWFALHDLLPESLADSAELRIAHERITVFDADWLHLEVMTDRFSVETRQAPHVRVRDLVARVFGERLSHTPLKAFGINRMVHFQVRSTTERDRIGKALAPVEPWGICGRNLKLDGAHGGLTSLTMSQLCPEGRLKGGSINVTIEPSVRVGENGIFMRVNDHYAIENTGPGASERLIKLFEVNFDTSLRRSDEIIDQIMSLAKSRED